MHVVNQHQRFDRVLAQAWPLCSLAEGGGHILVVYVDAVEDEHQGWHQEHDDPRAITELGNGKDDHHDERHHGADGVYNLFGAPVFVEAHDRTVNFNLLAWLHLAHAAPTHDHTRLRQRKRQEDADGIEGNQPGRLGLKDDNQARGHQRQRDDAPGEDQPPPAVAELLRQKTVGRDQGARRGKSA